MARDNAFLRELLAETLTLEGYTVEACASPDALLARADTADVILTDAVGAVSVELDERNRAYLQALAAKARTLLESGREWATPAVAEQLGLAGVLRKPFDLLALLAAVAAAVGAPH